MWAYIGAGDSFQGGFPGCLARDGVHGSPGKDSGLSCYKLAHDLHSSIIAQHIQTCTGLGSMRLLEPLKEKLAPDYCEQNDLERIEQRCKCCLTV